MLKQRLLILAIVYTITLTVVSLIKLNDLPDLGVDYGDKIFHFLAYGLLMLLWFLASEHAKKSIHIFYIAFLAIFYGIIIEVLQSELTNFRHYNVYDIVSNTLGVITMTLIIMIKNKTQVKKM